jgi:hypothetical protein
MQKRNLLLVIMICCLGASVAFAQGGLLRVTAYGSWNAPIGALSERFLSAPGAVLQFALKQGNPQWGGSLEYLEFTRENTEKLSLTRSVTDTASGTDQTYALPLPLLGMSLKAWGVTANASVGIWTDEFIETRVSVGFGIYYWKSFRSEYYDTLKVQSASGPLVAEVLAVPENRQEDWSGGFSLGVDLSVRVVHPVSIVAGGRYRAIIGELWPALALDLENVSTFQMVELRAGLSVDL